MSNSNPFGKTLEHLVLEINDVLSTRDFLMGDLLEKLYDLGHYLQPHLSSDLKSDARELLPYRGILQKLFPISAKDYSDLLQAIMGNHFDDEASKALVVAMGCYQYAMENAFFRIRVQDTLKQSGQKVCFKKSVVDFIALHFTSNQLDEKTKLIMAMKKVVFELVAIAAFAPAEKKLALDILIAEVKSINNLHLKSDSSIADVRTAYFEALEKARPQLELHRDSALQRVVSRMMRLIGYAFTLGGLCMWERSQNKPFAWVDIAKTCHRVNEKFADVLGKEVIGGMRLGFA